MAGLLAAVALAGCDVRDTNAPAGGDDGSAAPQVTRPEDPPEAPAPSPKGQALAEADSQNGEIRLSVTEAVRSNGVLTIKARTTLLSGATGSRTLLYPSDSKELYLVAGDQKYIILKDSEGDPLTTYDGYQPNFRQVGSVNNWWGKFPAPPAEVKSVGLYFKNFLPVENIPITDR
jgi:hypothetical protein